MDIWQVANVTGHGHIALIFDRPGLTAVPDAQVALPFVRVKRDEEDFRPLVAKVPRQFGKLTVIADKHADRSAIRFNGRQ